MVMEVMTPVSQEDSGGDAALSTIGAGNQALVFAAKFCRFLSFLFFLSHPRGGFSISKKTDLMPHVPRGLFPLRSKTTVFRNHEKGDMGKEIINITSL